MFSLPPHPSRRALLKAAAGLAAAALLPCPARAGAAPPATQPEGFLIEGGLVRLPARGQLYLANDFHTRHADFERWLKKTDLLAKLKGEEDVYGLILGDVVDAKPLDPEAQADGDTRMLEKIRQIQAGPGGKRLLYVLGNHEVEVVQIYEAMKKQLGLNASNRMRIIRALYASNIGDSLRGFNFIERITDEQAEYIKTLPVGVMCGNGVVCVHAGPSKKALGPKDLVQRGGPVLQELLWVRPNRNDPADGPPENLFGPDEIAAFLKRMDASRLLIVGHTPIPALPEAWIHDGLARVSEQCVITAASYGAITGQKRYLCIDLAKTYATTADLAAGKEIHSNM